jgi:DNA replication regulator SLD2
MDDLTRLEYESSAKTLRLELKAWENDWAKAHGKKPGREDIKGNADIGALCILRIQSQVY